LRSNSSLLLMRHFTNYSPHWVKQLRSGFKKKKHNCLGFLLWILWQSFHFLITAISPQIPNSLLRLTKDVEILVCVPSSISRKELFHISTQSVHPSLPFPPRSGFLTKKGAERLSVSELSIWG
jgi:hypothetical protein